LGWLRGPRGLGGVEGWFSRQKGRIEGRKKNIWERRCKIPEMYSILFWLAGRIVTIAPGTVGKD
jgi:hypothetical protein